MKIYPALFALAFLSVTANSFASLPEASPGALAASAIEVDSPSIIVAWVEKQKPDAPWQLILAHVSEQARDGLSDAVSAAGRLSVGHTHQDGVTAVTVKLQSRNGRSELSTSVTLGADEITKGLLIGKGMLNDQGGEMQVVIRQGVVNKNKPLDPFAPARVDSQAEPRREQSH